MIRIVVNILIISVLSTAAFAKFDEIKYSDQTYEGEVNSAGEMHGYGKIVWTKDPFNGDEFYGQFRDGKRRSGIYIYQSGGSFAGTYLNDNADLGVYTYKNGSKLYGYVDNTDDGLNTKGCGIYVIYKPYSSNSVCMYSGVWKESALSAYEKKRAEENYQKALGAETVAKKTKAKSLEILQKNRVLKQLKNRSSRYICTKATTLDGKWEKYDSKFGDYRKEADRRRHKLEYCNDLTGRGTKETQKYKPKVFIEASSVDTLCAAVGGCWRNGQVRNEFKEYLLSKKEYKALAFDREKILNRPPHAGATSSISMTKAEIAALEACEKLTKNTCIVVMKQNEVVHHKLIAKVNEIRNGTVVEPEVSSQEDNNNEILIVIVLVIIGFFIFIILSNKKKMNIKSQRLDSLGPVKRRQQELMDFEIISKTKNKQNVLDQNQEIDQKPREDAAPEVREKLEKATIMIDKSATIICPNCESENSSDKLICIVCGHALT